MSCDITTQGKISDIKTQYFNYIFPVINILRTKENTHTHTQMLMPGVDIIILTLLCLHRGIKQINGSIVPGVTENKVSHCERKEM